MKHISGGHYAPRASPWGLGEGNDAPRREQVETLLGKQAQNQSDFNDFIGADARI